MNLKHLTDDCLHHDIVALAGKERALLSQILWHLREIERRKLYSEHRCTSLFDYCVKKLKYSEGQAARRVSACRLLNDLPEIIDEIHKGELNLTQLNQMKNFFQEEAITDKNEKKKILGMIKGKTTRESETILWEMKQEDSPRKVSLTIKEETWEALKRLQDMKAHQYHDMDALLIGVANVVSRLWTPSTKRNVTNSNENSRYLPVQIKTAVWHRDQGKCRKCGSGRMLEYDHIKPFAWGGKTNLSNLQLLCRNCNQRKLIESSGVKQRMTRRS
jgi:hypothetical protein